MGKLGTAAAFVIALALVAPVAGAQKNCKKGIPCGNTCISASKTCRIGSSAPPKAPPPAPAKPASTRPSSPSSRPVAVKAQAARPVGGGNVPATRPLPDSLRHWVAAKDGRVYYARSCPVLADVDSAAMVFFRTEDEAVLAGYARSKVAGC